MIENGWTKLVKFMNTKEVGHIFTRTELLLWANLNNLSKNTIDMYRNQLVHAGIWKRVKSGTYELQSKLPENTTTTELYHLYKGDSLRYLEKVVARKERTARQLEEQAVEDALLVINNKIVTDAISKACLDCKGSFPRVAMTFSYRQSPGRERVLSRMILGETSRLLAEVQKCDILCMNCHLIRNAVARLA